jgi:hypothetical protein
MTELNNLLVLKEYNIDGFTIKTICFVEEYYKRLEKIVNNNQALKKLIECFTVSLIIDETQTTEWFKIKQLENLNNKPYLIPNYKEFRSTDLEKIDNVKVEIYNGISFSTFEELENIKLENYFKSFDDVVGNTINPGDSIIVFKDEYCFVSNFWFVVENEDETKYFIKDNNDNEYHWFTDYIPIMKISNTDATLFRLQN